MDINKAMTIFYGPNLSLWSLTLEQNIPTNTTGIILQDFIIITIGKLVIFMAKILDNVDTVTNIAQINILILGRRF